MWEQCTGQRTDSETPRGWLGSVFKKAHTANEAFAPYVLSVLWTPGRRFKLSAAGSQSSAGKAIVSDRSA